MANLRIKQISVNQLVMASKCLHSVLAPHEAHKRARTARTAIETHSSILGDAVHKFMENTSTVTVAKALQGELSTLSEPDREILLQEAVKIAEKKKSSQTAGDNVLVEQLQSWVDVQTSWTVFSKPDRVETLTDELGEYILVRDWKLSRRVRHYQKEAARIFGLIEYMRARGDMRVKIVVESLRTDSRPWTEWLTSANDAIRMLREIQDTFGRLDQAMLSEDHAKRTTGVHCNGCKIKESCRQGTKWLARNWEFPQHEQTKPSLIAA